MAGFLKKVLGVASGKKSGADRRNAFRVEIAHLRAKLAGKPISVAVRDISATGVALNAVAREFRPGNEIKVNLFQGSRLLLTDLNMKVVRVGKGFVGCEFVKLTPKQADLLHSITLDEQKKLADIKKKDAEKSGGEDGEKRAGKAK